MLYLFIWVLVTIECEMDSRIAYPLVVFHTKHHYARDLVLSNPLDLAFGRRHCKRLESSIQTSHVQKSEGSKLPWTSSRPGSRGIGVFGCLCSGPQYRARLSCWWMSSSWSRKKTTPLSAARRALRAENIVDAVLIS